jgi:hypothetical protein
MERATALVRFAGMLQHDDIRNDVDDVCAIPDFRDYLGSYQRHNDKFLAPWEPARSFLNRPDRLRISFETRIKRQTSQYIHQINDRYRQKVQTRLLSSNIVRKS